MCQKYQQKCMYWHSNMKPVHSEASLKQNSNISYKKQIYTELMNKQCNGESLS